MRRVRLRWIIAAALVAVVLVGQLFRALDTPSARPVVLIRPIRPVSTRFVVCGFQPRCHRGVLSLSKPLRASNPTPRTPK